MTAAVPSTPTSPSRYGAGTAPAARVLGTVNVMTVHPPALPSTPAPVPAALLPLGTLIPDNVATVQASMPASFDDARSVRSVSTVATTARLTDLDESGDDDDDAVPLHQPPIDAVRAAELAEGEAALASAQAYFEMFDEVEAHVVDLLVPRIKSFLTELSKTAEWLVRAPERTQKRVVIIGGGFCGSLVARLLDRFDQFQVCLIDAKPYSEYTAAIIRMIPNPTADSITIPHASYIRNGQFVLGYVDAVYKDHVLLQSSAPGAAAAGPASAAADNVLVGKRIPFDYCVLATGSSYASSVKAANISSTYRARKLQYDYAKLAKARTVLVIGGGSVGVEIASEIASVFGTPRVPIPPESSSSTTPTSTSGTRSTSPSPFRRGSASTTATRTTSPPIVKHPVKRIILVDANPRLLKRCPPRASQKALAYMRDVLGIDVVLGERITHHDARAGVFRARSGREFRADVVYLATGPVPQTQCMEPAFAHLLTGPNNADDAVDDSARASSTSNFFVNALANVADAAVAVHMVPRRVLYLRMKWDELKVKYFEYLQSPSDSSSARTAMLSPYYESEDAASVHSGPRNATLAVAAAATVAHELKF
ncbi:hypothetical protein AMAG_20413 [Allomyces macrogynus ATCC 38327]|uniref:FAD/NAD(P)-binding domain-containing protein n=1 Tax=Allomyces macrogynus (strain ATCC 38327) TaxID=578462 RepID=A0A0L0T8R8_ALLM3|nr:hypothetical protein AMAG_20413 [Allomyces macrogynus ATCC 38327]|eukprot:KNE71203.1 hypothetical protein AMAG_20413 [Allomyces macrogynus ATCC 38327]